MEQGAALALDVDLLRVIPRNDIYIRYLNDNRASIGELASEFYGRKLRVEVALNGSAGSIASGGAVAAPPEAMSAATPSSQPAGSPPPAAVPAASPESTPRPAPNIATDRQALYADPVVRRIFEEFQGRLVDVRERPTAAPSTAQPEELIARHPSTSSAPAAPPVRRPLQE